jgi:tetratricopeptide (TPR) repeat protein
MRQAWLLALLLALAAPSARAQFGKRVMVKAGTPEDKALSAIYAAGSPAEKIALLDKFAAQYGKGDLKILAGELYVEAYLAQNNYPKVYESGDQVLALDPNNLTVAAELVRAARAAGDLAKEFSYGDRVGAILSRVKASPPPAGVTAADWGSEKGAAYAKLAPTISYTQQLLYTSAANLPDAHQKIAMLERFLAAFPDSPYVSNAELEVAGTYRESGETAKMLEFARKRLAQDPNDIAMNLLLADYLSETGKDLGEAKASAQKALELLAAAKQPAGVSGTDWQKQLSVQKGLAYSALGQADVTRGRDSQAVEAFEQAAPLLESSPINYARNQYRLGYTLAKMRRFAEARKALEQAAALDTPFKRLAQEELGKLPRTRRAPRRR